MVEEPFECLHQDMGMFEVEVVSSAGESTITSRSKRGHMRRHVPPARPPSPRRPGHLRGTPSRPLATARGSAMHRAISRPRREHPGLPGPARLPQGRAMARGRGARRRSAWRCGRRRLADQDGLHDCRLVFAKGVGQARQGRQARVGELVERVGQRGGVAGIEHGRDWHTKVWLWRSPGQGCSSRRSASVACRPRQDGGGHPPGDLAGRGWSLARCVDRQTVAQRRDGHLDPLVVAHEPLAAISWCSTVAVYSPSSHRCSDRRKSVPGPGRSARR